MRNKTLFLIPVFSFLFLTACEDSNSDSPTETGKAIPNISVTCTTSTSAECDAASDSDEIYMVWTTDTCATFTGESINAYNLQPALCTTGTCASSNSGDWLDNDTDAVVATIPEAATTAAVWMNLVDNPGEDDGPEAGDVFCCIDDQSGAASLDDSNCQEIPST